jgi:hypothetical protein
MLSPFDEPTPAIIAVIGDPVVMEGLVVAYAAGARFIRHDAEGAKASDVFYPWHRVQMIGILP